MRKSIQLVAALALMLIIINSCTKDVALPEPCFQEDVLPIFVSKCSMEGCHGGGGGKNGRDSHGINLTNYEGIMTGVVANHPLQSKVYNNCDGLFPSMPPNRADKLTREQLSTIKYWINLGAPNTTNCSNGVCDTSKYSFATDVYPILKTNCVGCHSTSNKSGNIDLSSYSAVVSVVNSNRLIGSIKHSAGYISMPPSITLNACSIAKIEKWVANGNPNN